LAPTEQRAHPPDGYRIFMALVGLSADPETIGSEGLCRRFFTTLIFDLPECRLAPVSDTPTSRRSEWIGTFCAITLDPLIHSERDTELAVRADDP
jgi:hypothetical protein